MATFHVTWDIDVEADSAQEAAVLAADMQRDPESIATIYSVRDPLGRQQSFDTEFTPPHPINAPHYA